MEPNCTQCVCDVRDYPVKTCEELGGYSLLFSMRRRQCPKGYAVQYGAAFWDTQRERDSLAMAACVVTFTQLLLLTNKFGIMNEKEMIILCDGSTRYAEVDVTELKDGRWRGT